MGVGVRDRSSFCKEHWLRCAPFAPLGLLCPTAEALPATFCSLCRKTANVLPAPSPPPLARRTCPFWVGITAWLEAGCSVSGGE